MAVVAYLDPGAGGLIASTAAAGLAGAAVVARSGWRRAKEKLRRGSADPGDGREPAGEPLDVDTAGAADAG